MDFQGLLLDIVKGILVVGAVALIVVLCRWGCKRVNWWWRGLRARYQEWRTDRAMNRLLAEDAKFRNHVRRWVEVEEKVREEMRRKESGEHDWTEDNEEDIPF